MFPWKFWKVFQNSYSAEHMRIAAASNLFDLIKPSFEFHKSMTNYLYTKRNKRIVKNDLVLKMSLNITSNNNEKTSLDRKSKVYTFCETHDHQFKRGKNKQRHMTCLTLYRPVHQNKRFQYARATESDQQNAQLHTEGIRKTYEDRILSQLSEATRLFITSRFQDDGKLKEKVYDFTDEGYSDAHRNDSLSGKTRRLFDIYFTEYLSDHDEYIHL